LGIHEKEAFLPTMKDIVKLGVALEEVGSIQSISSEALDEEKSQQGCTTCFEYLYES
jgi:hypothetical protein